jgi:hypothetical protein
MLLLHRALRRVLPVALYLAGLANVEQEYSQITSLRFLLFLLTSRRPAQASGPLRLGRTRFSKLVPLS